MSGGLTAQGVKAEGFSAPNQPGADPAACPSHVSGCYPAVWSPLSLSTRTK